MLYHLFFEGTGWVPSLTLLILLVVSLGCIMLFSFHITCKQGVRGPTIFCNHSYFWLLIGGILYFLFTLADHNAGLSHFVYQEWLVDLFWHSPLLSSSFSPIWPTKSWSDILTTCGFPGRSTFHVNGINLTSTCCLNHLFHYCCILRSCRKMSENFLLRIFFKVYM